jgi:hypothetical protein
VMDMSSCGSTPLSTMIFDPSWAATSNPMFFDTVTAHA